MPIDGQRPKLPLLVRAVRLAIFGTGIAMTVAALYLTFRYMQRVIRFEGW